MSNFPSQLQFCFTFCPAMSFRVENVLIGEFQCPFSSLLGNCLSSHTGPHASALINLAHG